MDTWDEEVHGERCVFDDTFEMNAHLTPWHAVVDEDTDGKFGYYI